MPRTLSPITQNVRDSARGRREYSAICVSVLPQVQKPSYGAENILVQVIVHHLHVSYTAASQTYSNAIKTIQLIHLHARSVEINTNRKCVQLRVVAHKVQ